MKTLLYLQLKKIKLLLKIFKDKKWPQIIVFFSFLFIALIMAGFTYLFSLNSFNFLKLYPEFQQSLSFYLLNIWFFIIFILILGSGIISAIAVLFDQNDDRLLLAFPIKTQVIFESRFLNLLFLNSWPILVFGIPSLYAFSQSFNLSSCLFLTSCFALIFLLFISTVIVSIISILLVLLIGRATKKLLAPFLLLSIPLLAHFVSEILLPPHLIENFHNVDIQQIGQFLKALPINSPLLPSNWIVKFITGLPLNKPSSFINLFKLISLFMVLLFILYKLIEEKYFQALAKAKEGKFIAGPQDKIKRGFSKKNFPYFLKGLWGAFWEKDILTNLRSKTETSQALFLIFLLSLYLLILAKIPLVLLEKNLVQFSRYTLIKMNFAVICYFITIFALRYIFPSFGLEGQSAWLIWSAPFDKQKLYLQKQTSAWLFLSVISTFISFISGAILQLSIPLILGQTFLLIIIGLAISAINLGIGALLPNFEEKNPEKISTSFGGLLSTTISLSFIGLTNFLVFSFREHGFVNPACHLIILANGLLIALILGELGIDKIKKYGF